MSVSRRRILCVEGNEDLRALLMAMLSEEYDVVVAHTTMEGLKLARSQSFDLYLLDERFPDGTGLELCRFIRMFDEKTPILFYSAAGTDGRQALNAGAQCYVSQPNNLDELKTVIGQLVNPPDSQQPTNSL